MAQYQIGKCGVTNGSPIVTGVGTAWVNQVKAGNWFEIRGEGIWYDVLSVDSDVQITLKTPYLGTTKTGQLYVVQRDFTQYSGYPLMSYGDVDTGTLLGYALTAIDLQLAQVQPNLTGFANGTLAASGPMNVTGIVDGDLTVNGTLTFTGSQVVVNAQTLSCTDPFLTASSGGSGALYSGIKIERGTTDAFFVWNESIGRWMASISANNMLANTAVDIGCANLYASTVYGTLSSPSDARLKNVISNIGRPLWRVSQLSGVNFTWREDAPVGSSGKDVGLLAQEVERVLPEAVIENDGIKYVQYQKVIPLLVESIKALIEENRHLSARLSTLEGVVKLPHP